MNVPGLGHRFNLFNPSYTQMGVGVSKRTNQQLVVVQDFACTQ
ncbi:CAP domain-containing protein [Shewanella algae]